MKTNPITTAAGILLCLAVIPPTTGCGGSDNTGDASINGRIVSAQWVKENVIDNGNNGNPYVIAEFLYGPAGDYYNDGHIPGAVHVNSDEIEYDCFNARNDWPVDPGIPPCYDRSTTEEEDAAKGLGPDDTLPRNYWNLYPEQYLLPAIANMGIDKDTTVVVYAVDPTPAARLVMTLRYAGVEDVYLLDGGYAAWIAAGYEGETEANARVPVADFGLAQAARPDYFVDAAYVRQVVAGDYPNSVLADVRTNGEYTGATTPYDYIPTAGRIAGAVYAHGSVESPYDMNYVVGADGALKPFEEIDALWQEDGLSPDQQTIFYCGTGWRAALTFLIAEAMGWNDIAYYEGGWMEWSMGPEVDQNPVESDTALR